jgi:hypothetical protein
MLPVHMLPVHDTGEQPYPSFKPDDRRGQMLGSPAVKCFPAALWKHAKIDVPQCGGIPCNPAE